MRKLILTALIISSFAFGIFLSLEYQKSQNVLSEATLYFEQARNLPVFNALNHLNQEVSNEILINRWSILFFGFTNCPDVCPNTLSILTEVQKRFANKNIKPQIVFISVDPMRDTPELMTNYINGFSDDIIGLTGELHQIQVLTEALGVAYGYNALPDGSYTVDHFSGTFIINPKGEYVGLHTEQLSAADSLKTLIHDFTVIAKKEYRK